MTPYSAAAVGRRSRRPSSRSAALRTSSGSVSAGPAARAARSPRPARGRPRRAPAWIAFSCWRRKYSRWPFSISDCTCDWIFEPSSSTSTSRERIAEMWRRRCSTSACSRSSWRSSVGIVRSVEATRWASALGSSTFVAASCSSAGRYGARPMICAKRPWTLRVSASTSGVSAFSSGSASNSPTRYGSLATARRAGSRCRPPTRIRSVPSGILIILWTTRDRADLVDVVQSRRVDRRVARGDEREEAVAGDDIVDQPDRALLPDRERHHRLREHDRVLQRAGRQRRRELELGLGVLGHLEGESVIARVHHDRVARPAAAAVGDRQRDRDDAVLVAALAPVGIDVLGEPDLPLEGPVLDLHLLVDAAAGAVARPLAGDQRASAR